MKEFGKNFLIAFLMIFAVYQTTELWFGDFSSHSFFSYVFNTEKTDSEIGGTMKYMLINYGDNKITCVSSNLDENELKQNMDQLISQALTEGEAVAGTEDISWKNILSRRCVIYEYSFVMPSDLIINTFDAKKTNADKIKYCNSIIISPEADGSAAEVLFYNSRDESQYVIKLKSKNNLIRNCYNAIGGYTATNGELNYISSEKNGFDIFRNNVFIPQWSDKTYTYDRIVSQPTVNDTVSAEENANVFFDNPAGKWKTEDENGSLIFSDETTVVKYTQNGVLEYNNYKVSHTSEESFSDNYKAACALINKDRFVQNEYYLKSYSTQNGKFVFCFDYKTDDKVINLNSELKNKIGMTSAIEVTTNGGRVSKYRRYACSYNKQDLSDYAAIDFVTAADSLYNELGSVGDKPVDNMELAFVDNGESVELRWIINIDGRDYIRNVRNQTGAR